jgi:hypothetical protein
MNDSILGKKVFFLYPPSVIKDDVITRLLEQEFEVYLVKDHETASRLVRAFPASILYVNIDTGMSEPEWEEWIRDTIRSTAPAGTGIGILSYNADEVLQKKYLIDIGVQCGFVKLKLGAEESTRILITTLTAAEAKGRRKYVRVACANDTLSSVNIREGQIQVTGNINDISVVGFSCTFNPDPNFRKNALLTDVQLRLRGSLLRTEAIVFGTRGGEQTTYVLLFTTRMDPLSRRKVRGYIQTALQNEIEQAELPPAGARPVPADLETLEDGESAGIGELL